MEFLVRIDVNWPPEGDQAQRAELTVAESEVARELILEGVIVRLWRVPGQWANVGIWQAQDATALHAAILRLPFFRWLAVEVEPLADHPSDPGHEGQLT